MKRIAEGATRIFLSCGTTDFRKQIPGLVAAVTLSFKLDPYNGDYQLPGVRPHKETESGSNHLLSGYSRYDS